MGRVLSGAAAEQATRCLWDVYDDIATSSTQPPVPTTLAEWSDRSEAWRVQISRSLGVVPARPEPPTVDVLGRTDRHDYSIERLAITTRPGMVVTANLYLPSGARTPAPAILCPHGHSDGGKAADAYQRLYIGLVQRGFVVLAPDAIGYGEREELGHWQIGSPFLIGSSLIGMEVWDNQKCLDVLCARPEVDAERLGCMGNSGGGGQTMWTSALDERIAAAVVSDHSGTFAYIHAKARVLCTCVLAPRLVPHMELHHVLGLIAPRPLLLLGGQMDHFFPWDMQLNTYRLTRRIYGLHETGDSVEQFIASDGHSLTRTKREAAYSFFLRRLGGLAEAEAAEVAEETEAVETLLPTDPALRCFPTKPPVLRRSLDVMVRREASQMSAWTSPTEMADWPAFSEQRRQRLESLLLLRFVAAETVRVERATTNSGNEGVCIWTDQRTPLAGELRDLPGATSVQVIVDSDGKDSGWAQARLAPTSGRARSALAIDLPGWGELTPTELSPDGEADEQVAVVKALGYDAPLLGLRVKNLLLTIGWVAQTWPGLRIELVGRGFGAWVAVIAGVLHESVQEVELDKLPPSFFPGRHHTYRYRGPNAFGFVPGLVRDVGDVPHLLALLAPKPCRITAFMSDVEFLEPEQALDVAQQAYEAAGAPDALECKAPA